MKPSFVVYAPYCVSDHNYAQFFYDEDYAKAYLKFIRSCFSDIIFHLVSYKYYKFFVG